MERKNLLNLIVLKHFLYINLSTYSAVSILLRYVIFNTILFEGYKEIQQYVKHLEYLCEINYEYI